jgi:hypothetical protein
MCQCEKVPQIRNISSFDRHQLFVFDYLIHLKAELRFRFIKNSCKLASSQRSITVKAWVLKPNAGLYAMFHLGLSRDF